jgi:hypothetical protein
LGTLDLPTRIAAMRSCDADLKDLGLALEV